MMIRAKTGLATTAATLLALGASGCSTLPGPLRSGDPMRADGSSVTVLVENDGLTTLALYSDASRTRLGTVGSGESECFALRVLTSQRLLARPTGGGDAIVSPPFEPTGGQGWRWTLRSSTVGDALSLVPAELCETEGAP